MSKKCLTVFAIISALILIFNNSDISAQQTCITLPPGQPPKRLSVVQQVAQDYPSWLKNAYHPTGRPNGTWQFMDEVVNRLRQEDAKWAYNGKRGNLNDPSPDAISYYYGPGATPQSGTISTYEVYVIDIISAVDGPNPQPAWTNVTKSGNAKGAYLYPRTAGGSLPSVNWCSGGGGGGGGGGGVPGSMPPELLFAEPNDVKPGEKINIIGLYLTPNITVKSLSSGLEKDFTASLNTEKTRATITLPDDIPPGSYAVTVSGVNGEATAPNFLTVLQKPMGPSEIPEAKDFGDLIENIFTWALWLVGAAIFVNFLWAGLLWFTAAGRTGPIGQAKEKMTNALIGAIILLASYLILNTINPDLVKQTFILPGL